MSTCGCDVRQCHATGFLRTNVSLTHTGEPCMQGDLLHVHTRCLCVGVVALVPYTMHVPHTYDTVCDIDNANKHTLKRSIALYAGFVQ